MEGFKEGLGGGGRGGGTWVESVACVPADVSISSPAIAQGTQIFQALNGAVPHIACLVHHGI